MSLPEHFNTTRIIPDGLDWNRKHAVLLMMRLKLGKTSWHAHHDLRRMSLPLDDATGASSC